ncbi:F-box/LRR-repeat protein 17 [Lemmus lemmus]
MSQHTLLYSLHGTVNPATNSASQSISAVKCRLLCPAADCSAGSLIAIGRYSVTIETVDVGWCKEITDQGATLIAQSSKSLRYLGLMRCDKVNEVTVEQLVQQYPHITFSTVLQDCKRTLERAYQMGWTPNMSAASS